MFKFNLNKILLTRELQEVLDVDFDEGAVLEKISSWGVQNSM